jgi:ribosomal protein L33
MLIGAKHPQKKHRRKITFRSSETTEEDESLSYVKTKKKRGNDPNRLETNANAPQAQSATS